MFGGRAAETPVRNRQNGSRRYRGNRRGRRASRRPNQQTIAVQKNRGSVRQPQPRARFKMPSRTSRSECQDPVLKQTAPCKVHCSASWSPRQFAPNKQPPRCARPAHCPRQMDTRVHGGGDTGAPAALAPSVTEPPGPTKQQPRPLLRFPAFRAINRTRTPYQFRSTFATLPITNEIALVANTFPTTLLVRTIRDAETDESER